MNFKINWSDKIANYNRRDMKKKKFDDDLKMKIS